MRRNNSSRKQSAAAPKSEPCICIIDDYTRLKFKQKPLLVDLQVGQMIQIVDSTKPTPRHWEWREVNEMLIIALARDENRLQYVRVPINI
jgi:hypothetical protein